MKSERMNTMSYGRDLVDSGLKTDMTVSKEETNLFEGKEGLALKLLLSNLGDEDAMNKTCDFIKENGLVDDYK